MPGWGWLRLMLPPGWPGSWRPCGVRTVVPLPLRTLLPPREGWPVRDWLLTPACGWVLLPVRGCVLPTEGAACWREGVEGRVWEAEEPLRTLPLLRVLLPPRLTWPLLLPLREEEGIDGWVLRWAGEDEELRFTEPRPLVWPDWPEERIWEEGADIEEEGRPPPLRALPPPEPPRELLPPLVWAPRGTAIIAAAAMAIRESVVKRFIIV